MLQELKTGADYPPLATHNFPIEDSLNISRISTSLTSTVIQQIFKVENPMERLI